MKWQRLLDSDIKKFIAEHEGDDVGALALKKPVSADWDYPLVLDQIKSRQKAKVKLPSWAAAEGRVILPRPDLIEQASSEACARYKATLIKGQSFVDLTGGAGVDTLAFAAVYEEGVVVECDEEAAALISHNMQYMSIKPLKVKVMRAEEYVKTMPRVDLAYIDPQRRDVKGKGRFRFEDCSPDILGMLPDLLKKADHVIVKASPILDIQAGIEALGAVEAVHIVEWRGDCREILFILGAGGGLDDRDVPITAVDIDDFGTPVKTLVFTKAQESEEPVEHTMPLRYFYEPSPAFLKAGAFRTLAVQFGLKKLHEHTHLYTGDELVSGFPGRVFETMDVYPVKSKMVPFDRAHVAVRNFPMKAEDLRRKLKLKDGGNIYIFGCMLADGKVALVAGQKP